MWNIYNSKILLTIQVVAFLLIFVNLSKCNEKPETNIKNLTAIDQAKPKKPTDDPFKKDLRKFMRECGADVSGEDDDDNGGGEKHSGEQSAEQIPVPKGQRPKDGAANANWAYEKRRGGKGGTYPSHYGKRKGGGRRGSEEESEEEDDEDDYRGSSNRRKGGNRRNNRKGNKKGRPSSDDYDDSRGDNCDDDRKGGYSSGGRKGFNSQWGSMGGGGMGYNRGGGGSRYNSKNYGYSGGFSSGSDPFSQKTDYGIIYSSSPDLWGARLSTYGGRLMAMNSLRREKRQKNEELCMSQCVFGYLEMLDDNRVPAETEVIKYFQNKILNSSERMRLIKLARKCFAKLSTAEIAENEDGCQFSKDLARCLQIEIKGETV